MITTVFQSLGKQLLAARKNHRLSQPALAERVGRNRARIAELERELPTRSQTGDRHLISQATFAIWENADWHDPRW